METDNGIRETTNPDILDVDCFKRIKGLRKHTFAMKEALKIVQNTPLYRFPWGMIRVNASVASSGISYLFVSTHGIHYDDLVEHFAGPIWRQTGARWRFKLDYSDNIELESILRFQSAIVKICITIYQGEERACRRVYRKRERTNTELEAFRYEKTAEIVCT